MRRETGGTGTGTPTPDGVGGELDRTPSPSSRRVAGSPHTGRRFFAQIDPAEAVRGHRDLRGIEQVQF